MYFLELHRASALCQRRGDCIFKCSGYKEIVQIFHTIYIIIFYGQQNNNKYKYIDLYLLYTLKDAEHNREKDVEGGVICIGIFIII